MGKGNSRQRPYLTQVRDAALTEFSKQFGDRQFAPVVAVIAAYNEQDCIGATLDAVPAEACGLPVETLVVDDGSRDRTAEVVARHEGVHLARLSRNCGHGVALRLGYQVAREHGAQYIVTLDADLQWDPAELPTVLAPVAEGDADFCLGSRVLGRAETDDRLRGAGVTFFAWLVSRLTGVHVTDTSSGFRAMRAELTGKVPQSQVQYQTSELLIGAIYHGYRVTERPITMHKRLAGESKKGHNLLYGVRYARVILTTWAASRSQARRAGRSAGR